MIHLIIAKGYIISNTALPSGNMVFLAAMCTSTSLSVLSLSFIVFAMSPIMSTLVTVILTRMGTRILEMRITMNPLHPIYAGGEKVKICISFENKKFPITYVRKFVSQSQVEGYQVTFVGYTFTDAMILRLSAEMWHVAFVYCTVDVAKYTQVIYDKVMDHLN